MNFNFRLRLSILFIIGSASLGSITIVDFVNSSINKYEKLSNFLRMLNVSIPHKCFDVIKSYALLLIDQERNLIDAGLNL